MSQDCLKNYWGENCDKRCESHCDGSFGCDKVSGTCNGPWCDNGYWGSYCNHRCQENCVSWCRRSDGFCTSCRDGAYFYGACNVSCSEVWPHCKTCSYNTSGCATCYTGYWKRTCDNKCTVGCHECHKQNGTCLTCLPKFWGNNCSNPCPWEHCSHCRLSDGLCERCDEGYWGESCQNTCDLIGCEDSICEKNTGICDSCKTNYWGDFCNNTCEIKNCISSYISCPKSEGMCSECEFGKWGSLCENSCSENCTGVTYMLFICLSLIYIVFLVPE